MSKMFPNTSLLLSNAIDLACMDHQNCHLFTTKANFDYSYGSLKESLHTISMTILLFRTTKVCSLETSLSIVSKKNYKKMNLRGLNGA